MIRVMRVGIAGGHGKVGFELGRLLVGRGDQVVGLIRGANQAATLRDAGIEPAVCDLERASVADVAAALQECDAAVFAAGAGPGSGAARKDSMDRAGAARFAAAAEAAGVQRYLLISAMGLERAASAATDPVFQAYLRAKAASEADLRDRDLVWTILRPGRLTDEPGSGRVTLARPSLPAGAVSRADVASVVVALLDEPTRTGDVLELTSGGSDDLAVEDAVAKATDQDPSRPS